MSCKVVTPTDRPSAPGAKAPASALHSTRPMILVIDDDPEIRGMIERCLMPICDVMTAESGVVAVRLLDAHPFALVLLDLHMPFLDGFTILRTLRRSHANRDTQVFVVTADVAPETQAKVMRLGASMAITKPFHPMALRTLVESRLKKNSGPVALRTGSP